MQQGPQERLEPLAFRLGRLLAVPVDQVGQAVRVVRALRACNHRPLEQQAAEAEPVVLVLEAAPAELVALVVPVEQAVLAELGQQEARRSTQRSSASLGTVPSQVGRPGRQEPGQAPEQEL